MSQWVPMHGLAERDFASILKTFHSAFPFVALYYAGGFKGVGHLVMLGSKRPLRIDVPHAERLFANAVVRDDLAGVNVLDLPDLFSGFLFDQGPIDSFAGDAPLNTDDKPIVAFATSDPPDAPSGSESESESGSGSGTGSASASESASATRSWLGSIARYRQSIYPQLSAMSPEDARGIEQGLRVTFDATGHAFEGQVIEGEEYASRVQLDLDHPDGSTRSGLERSRGLLARAMEQYSLALQTNPQDAHTRGIG